MDAPYSRIPQVIELRKKLQLLYLECPASVVDDVKEAAETALSYVFGYGIGEENCSGDE